MFDAKQIILLLSSLAICAPGQVQVDNIHNLALPLDRDQVGRQDLRVETSLGPVVGEERWGWDSRFNQQISYTAFTVCREEKSNFHQKPYLGYSLCWTPNWTPPVPASRPPQTLDRPDQCDVAWAAVLCSDYQRTRWGWGFSFLTQGRKVIQYDKECRTACF